MAREIPRYLLFKLLESENCISVWTIIKIAFVISEPNGPLTKIRTLSPDAIVSRGFAVSDNPDGHVVKCADRWTYYLSTIYIFAGI